MAKQSVTELQAELEALKKLRESNTPLFTPEFIDDQIKDVEGLIQKQLTENRRLLNEDGWGTYDAGPAGTKVILRDEDGKEYGRQG